MVSMSFLGSNPRPPDGRGDGGFAELSAVMLARALDVDGRCLPSGARGLVVGAYADGLAFEVEFHEPFHAVVTVEAGDLLRD